MTNKEFRSIFEDVKCSDEFKASMRKKLEADPSAAYSETIENTAVQHRSRIVHIISSAAACIALVISCAALGISMRNTAPEGTPSATEATESTSVEAETVMTPDVNYEPIALPEIDPENMSVLELQTAGIKYYYYAELYYHAHRGGYTPYPFAYDQDGMVITADDGEYSDFYLLDSEYIRTKDAVRKDFYTVFSEIWSEHVDDFFLETEEGLYYQDVGRAYLSDENFRGYEIALKDACPTRIVYTVTSKFEDESGGMERIPVDFVLIPENGSWKVARYAPASEVDSYYNRLNLPCIDTVNASDEELIEMGREYLRFADYYCLETALPPDYRFDASGEEYVLPDGETKYYPLYDIAMTEEDIMADFRSVYTEDYVCVNDAVFANLTEDMLYVKEFIGGDFTGFHDFSGDTITVKSRSANEFVLTVEMDCTFEIRYFFDNNFDPEVVNEILGEDYKYTYAQDVVFVRDGMDVRIKEYIPQCEIGNLAMEVCEDLDPYRDPETGHLFVP